MTTRNTSPKFLKKIIILTGLLLVVALIINYLLGDQLFSEKWSSPKDITPKNLTELKKKWTSINGNWTIKNNKLYAATGDDKEFEILFKNTYYGDVAIEFKAMIEDEAALNMGGDLSALLSCSKNSSQRYDMQIGAMGNKIATIQMVHYPLAKSDFKLVAGKTYLIRAEKEGENLRLYCDGNLILKAKNRYFINGPYIGLYTYGSGKYFWDIKVYQKKYKTAEGLFENGDRYLQKALAHESKMKSVFIDSARKEYQKLISNKKPKISQTALYRLAILEKNIRNYDAFNKVVSQLKQDNQNLETALLMAEASFRNKDYDNSLKQFHRIIEAFPKNSIEAKGLIKQLLSERPIIKLQEEINQKFWAIITKDDYKNNFIAEWKNLKSLNFLSKNTYTYIGLNNNLINDIEGIKHCTKARSIDLNNNQIVDIQALKDIKSLKGLSLQQNPISDISSISLMKSITSLNLSKTKIKNLKALEDLKDLKSLYISETNIQDKSILKKLKLETLVANKAGIKNINQLDLSNTINLRLIDNEIEDISLLKDTKISYLDLSNNKIKDFSVLKKIELKALLICGNPITTLEPFYTNTPVIFKFDCDSLSVEEYQKAIDYWKKDPTKIEHIKNAIFYIANRSKDKAKLQAIAHTLNDHKYLNVPIAMLWEDAQKYCEQYGAHLVTITSKNENNFITNLPIKKSIYWIGLSYKNESSFRKSWVTDEVLSFQKIKATQLSYTKLPAYTISTKNGTWHLSEKSTQKVEFIMEWDK